jgi:MFS transporter, DHA2 family, multidrug resistance protein
VTGEVSGSKAGITIVVMIAAMMALVDISIINVALNDIRASFGTPLDQIGWVTTSYMMANIVVIPMTGWFQRRFGYRRYFVASTVLFTVSSALCGIAWSLPTLVFCRVLQGMGGGAIIPTANAILFARYPRQEHGMAAALFGLGAITGPLMGPTIGGYLIAWSSWHWIFLVNVPLGVLVCVLTLRFVREPGFQPRKEKIDAFGVALLALGMPSLQYVLEEGNREGWFESRTITTLSFVAAIALITFVVHELETTNPVVDLRVFANRSYAAGSAINFLAGLALFGSTYLVSLFCGTILHYAALDIGRVFMIAGFAQLLLMPLVGRLSPLVDGRIFLFIGIACAAGSQWMAATLTSSSGFDDLVRLQLLRAVGLACVFIPVNVLALSDLSPAHRGNASGLFNLTRELGGSLGTAWMGMIVTDGMAVHRSAIASHVTPFHPMVQEQLRTIARVTSLAPDAILQRRISRQALVLSFEDGFRKTALAILIGLVLVLLVRRPREDVSVNAAH